MKATTRVTGLTIHPVHMYHTSGSNSCVSVHFRRTLESQAKRCKKTYTQIGLSRIAHCPSISTLHVSSFRRVSLCSTFSPNPLATPSTTHVPLIHRHHATVPFVLQLRSRSHMPLRLKAKSAYRGQAQSIIWAAFSEVGPGFLLEFRKRHRAFSGISTPPHCATTGPVAGWADRCMGSDHLFCCGNSHGGARPGPDAPTRQQERFSSLLGFAPSLAAHLVLGRCLELDRGTESRIPQHGLSCLCENSAEY